MLNIIENIYDNYLKKISELNQKIRYENEINPKTGKKWFQISGAGSCIKKHFYKIFNFEPTPLDPKSQRLLRLGDLIHKDIQQALIASKEFVGSKNFDNLITEYEVTVPELNIRGFLDIAFINHEPNLTKPVFILDIKTVSAYKWTKMFGREENKDKEPSIMYELQVATYAYALSQQLHIDVLETQPALLYYKKDDSSLKLVNVFRTYVDEAISYWKKLVSLLDVVTPDNIEEVLVPGDIDIPVMEWECKWSTGECPFLYICGGIKKKMKKKYIEILWKDRDNVMPLLALGRNGHMKSEGIRIYYGNIYSTIIPINSRGLGSCYIEIPTEKLKELTQELERSFK